MIVKWNDQVTDVPVDMDGAKDVTMKILIGTDDGSANIVVRMFTVAPGGHTPHHTHDFEHLVQVQAGRGAVIDSTGQPQDLAPGQSVFVPPLEKHQFINKSNEPFIFTCTIPNPNPCCQQDSPK